MYKIVYWITACAAALFALGFVAFIAWIIYLMFQINLGLGIGAIMGIIGATALIGADYLTRMNKKSEEK